MLLLRATLVLSLLIRGDAFSLGSLGLSGRFGALTHGVSWNSLGVSLHIPFLRKRPCSRSSEQQSCDAELAALRRWHSSLEDGQSARPSRTSESEAASRKLLQVGDGSDVPLELQWDRKVKKVERDLALMTSAELRGVLKEQREELQRIRDASLALQAEIKNLTKRKSKLDGNLTRLRLDFSKNLLTPKVMSQARDLIKKCNGEGLILSQMGPVWKGYSCSASDNAFAEYYTYRERGMCSDDWPDAQKMIFVGSCFALPKRRCHAPTSAMPREPIPFPRSLFDQRALIDENVRWTRHDCKSFRCLNTRTLGDCRNCFNMTLEGRRWRRSYRGSLPMAELIEMKKGSLRIGLDAGGGSGSFAAHMALHGVTVMTTAMNIETVDKKSKGIPYMETIALRGLVALHWPHKARLPFFDNTLDIIHCVNSVKYLPILEFEELLYEWDRVLRVGGVMWFEMFYAPLDELPVYVALIEQLGYKKLHWNVTPKPDFGEKLGVHAYLNCVIEKPVRKDRS